MQSDESKQSVGLFGLIFLLLVSAVIAYWWALFLYPLWGWFIYPTFGVALPSNPWLVAGMIMTVKYIIHTSSSSEVESIASLIGSSIITPPITWLIGYAYFTFGGGI